MGKALTARLKDRLAADTPLNSEWLWPSATSASGHIEEPKEAGLPSPHEYRHHARTLFIASGVPYAESALLLGQKLPGASGGYVHAEHLVEHLRQHAQALEYFVYSYSKLGYAPSTYLDNPTIDTERYARSIIASSGGDRALAEAWLNNNWSELAGAFFADVFGDHCVIADSDFRVPGKRINDHGWYSCVALDWGWSAPTAAALAIHPLQPGLIGPGGRVFPKGSWIIIDEVHSARADDPSLGKGWPPQMVAEEVLAACERWGVRPRGVGDDARGLQNDTLLDQLSRHGLTLVKPQKDRISGWVKVKSLMSAARDGDPDTPGLWISERCRFALETLPLLPRDDVRLEDVDTSANDHFADALRYLVNSPLQIARFGRTNLY